MRSVYALNVEQLQGKQVSKKLQPHVRSGSKELQALFRLFIGVLDRPTKDSARGSHREFAPSAKYGSTDIRVPDGSSLPSRPFWTNNELHQPSASAAARPCLRSQGFLNDVLLLFDVVVDRGSAVNTYSHFEFSEDEIIRPEVPFGSSEWRLLRRLRIPDRFNEPHGGSLKRALVIDVEATGLSIERDDVVQIALLPFDYEVETGRILSVYKDQAFEQMREPAVPMSEEATLVTGITNEMLAGQSIDSSAVAALVAEVDLVIAHNARFDRGMVERHWQCFSEKPWACTLTSVDWLREGFSAGKLDYLGMQYGWFYSGIFPLKAMATE